MKITPRQMTMWRRMEAEHTPSKAGQERIVKQHIAEFGMRYYPELRKMEMRLKRKK